MARSLESISLSATLSATLKNTLADGTTAFSGSVGRQVKLTLTSGITANKADRGWEAVSRALADAATEDIDLYDLASVDIGGGAGKDASGQAFVAAEIVGLLIHNSPDSVGSLKVGGKGTAAAWNSIFDGDDDAKLVLPPGAFVALGCPADPAWAVADTTNHLLKMEASGGAVTYTIALLARSA